MTWLAAALVAPFLFSATNVIDSRLSNRHFRSVTTLIFCGTVLGTVFLPLVLLAGVPRLPPLGTLVALIAVGVLETAYLFPYYLALRHEDSSVVVALFALGDLFVPALSYVFLGERLQTGQYLGFAVIVAGSFALAWRPGARVSSVKALLLMLATTLLLAADYIIYKHALGSVDWSTGFFWPRLVSFVVVMPLLVLPAVRRDLHRLAGRAGRAVLLLGTEELFNFAGTAAVTLALILAPVTVVKGVGAVQPVVVIFYAWILGRRFPDFLQEQLDRRNIIGKVAISAAMIVGVVLVVG